MGTFDQIERCGDPDCYCADQPTRDPLFLPEADPAFQPIRRSSTTFEYTSPPRKEIEGLTHPEAVDALNDVLSGFEAWKDAKVASGNWQDIDESLARWIEAGPVGDRV